MAWNALIIAVQGGRAAFGFLLTQEARARECHSFLSSCSWFETRQEGRRREMREGRREELTGLRQTQRMAAAVDPCCPPTLQQEHIH